MNQMAIGATGDFARSEKLNRARLESSQQMDQASHEISTGLKGDSYKDIAQEASSALSIGTAKQAAHQYQKNIDLVDERLNRAEASVNEILSVMEEFRSRLAGVVQPGNQDSQFKRFCEDSLERVAQALSTQDIGRNNIFGGNEWATPPVDLAALPVPILGGSVSTAYYQGTTDTLTVKINEEKNLDYGVRADNSAFAKTFHALKIGASITPDYQEGSANMQLLRNAITVGAEATTELSETLASIGTSRKTLETERGMIDDFLEVADELEGEYIGADVIGAWVWYNQLESQNLSIITIASKLTELNKQLVSFLS